MHICLKKAACSVGRGINLTEALLSRCYSTLLLYIIRKAKIFFREAKLRSLTFDYKRKLPLTNALHLSKPFHLIFTLNLPTRKTVAYGDG